MNIPEDVLYIITMLEKNNFEAFVVGGCVRDYVLGNTPKDFDITTDALPEDIKNIFEHTVDTGIEHGTVTVIFNNNNFNNNYEVTTYRIDGDYLDNRHPENVIFTKNLVEDLSRRDFTMNALAYNPKKGIIDPFNGQEDIKNKIIRGVGDPDKRFKEDALRIMRGVRFSAQLNFNIEEETFSAMKNNAHLVKNISIERIRDEFFKLLLSNHIQKIDFLNTTGVYKYFMPELEVLFNSNSNFNSNYINILHHLDKNLRFTYILILINSILNKISDKNSNKNSNKNALFILNNFRLDNRTIKDNKTILKYFDDNFIDDRALTRKFMSLIEPDLFKKIISIKFIISLAQNDLITCKMYDNIFDQIDETIRKNYCYNLKMLDLNGDDLKNIGVSNGKDIGKYLKLCLELVLNQPEKNKKSILLKYITSII